MGKYMLNTRYCQSVLTGEVAPAKKSWLAAAGTWKKVTMELGGKISFWSYFDDADSIEAVTGAIDR